MERNRQLIFKGMEHIVWSARGSDDCVLKTPRFFNRLSFLFRDPKTILDDELAIFEMLVDGTNIEIPQTRIFTIWTKLAGVIPIPSYIVQQKRVYEDESIPDKQKYLSECGLMSLVDECVHEPRNFISNSGVLYWVDPTKGTVGRVLEALNIMNLEKYRQIRRKNSKAIRSLGL